MDKFTHLSEFLGYLFDDATDVEKAKAITACILKAYSCRLSDIAREMSGNESGNYKCIQRFVARNESIKSILLRLYQEEAPFMIGDPTEMPQPQVLTKQLAFGMLVTRIQLILPAPCLSANQPRLSGKPTA
jgi:hypothetical protein